MVPNSFDPEKFYKKTVPGTEKKLSIVEAMASGLPCIVCDLPVLREIDEDYKHILVVNTKEQALEKILFLHENKTEMKDIGAKARQFAFNKFAADQNAEMWGKSLSDI